MSRYREVTLLNGVLYIIDDPLNDPVSDSGSGRHFKGNDTQPCENCGEYFSQHGPALQCPANVKLLP